MTESELQQLIQIEGSKYDCILLRNNSGAAIDSTGRHIRFGLGNISKEYSEKMKSSDLIGFTMVTITPEMVGQRLPVFTTVECKDPAWQYSPKDKRAVAQKNFIDWIRYYRGFAGFAKSIDDFKRIIGI